MVLTPVEREWYERHHPGPGTVEERVAAARSRNVRLGLAVVLPTSLLAPVLVVVLAVRLPPTPQHRSAAAGVAYVALLLGGLLLAVGSLWSLRHAFSSARRRPGALLGALPWRSRRQVFRQATGSEPVSAPDLPYVQEVAGRVVQVGLPWSLGLPLILAANAVGNPRAAPVWGAFAALLLGAAVLSERQRRGVRRVLARDA